MDKYDVGAGLLGGLQQGLSTYFQTSAQREQRKRDEAFKLAQLQAQGYDVSDMDGNISIKPSESMVKKQKMEGLLEARKAGLIPVYDEAGNIADYKADLEMLRAKKPDFGLPMLTKGQEAADVSFGKDYSEYEAQGGKANIQKNLGLLKEAVGKLESGKAKTGGLSTKIPLLSSDVAQEVLNPEAVSVRDSIRTGIQSTLRQTLGAAFTEKEGTQIFERAFNPRLSTEENIRRAQAEIAGIEAAANAKEEAIEYYRQRGTLAGFRPKGSGMPQGLIQPQGAQASPQRKIRVTNGKETLLIDAADLQEAMADGYRQAQ